MANLLKNVRLTSVDLVREGANQEANICLFKSAKPPNIVNQQPPNGGCFFDAILQEDGMIMPIDKIDKSRLTPEEQAQLDSLLAKASNSSETQPKASLEETATPPMPSMPLQKMENAEPPKPEKPETPPLEVPKAAPAPFVPSPEPSQEASPILTAALERLANLEKSIEMERCAAVAEKYALLGDDPQVLTKTLYEMKKSNPANYDAYIQVLDKSLDLVRKSGLFDEIGKSGSAATPSALDKINSVATEIRKANPSLSVAAAQAQAWQDHPELVQEYDAEYFAQS